MERQCKNGPGTFLKYEVLDTWMVHLYILFSEKSDIYLHF